MWLLAAILLFSATSRGQVVDEVEQIPAGDWKYREIQMDRPGRIVANYEVVGPQGQARAALMLREDLERMDEDLPGAIVQTAIGRKGNFADTMRRRGDFVVVLDNQQGRLPVSVHLQVWLDFGAGLGRDAEQLTPRRRLVVVAISGAVFCGIVGFSARRLLSGLRR